jgi:hypothetical protein
MSEIFISYRRADSQAISDRLHEYLARAFGERNVFKDVDDIPIGADFRKVLHERVTACDVLLVVIGREWANVAYDDGTPRLDDPNDFVRIEVESGLSRDDLLVLPVLVNGARMPNPDRLPDGLREVCYRNAVEVRNDPDFRNDMQRLINQLSAIMRPTRKRRAPSVSLPRPRSSGWSARAGCCWRCLSSCSCTASGSTETIRAMTTRIPTATPICLNSIRAMWAAICSSRRTRLATASSSPSAVISRVLALAAVWG